MNFPSIPFGRGELWPRAMQTVGSHRQSQTGLGDGQCTGAVLAGEAGEAGEAGLGSHVCPQPLRVPLSLSHTSSAEEVLPPLLAISGSLCTCPSLHLSTLPDWTFPEGRGHISPAQRPLRVTSLFLISCFHNGVAHNFDLSENLLPAGSPGLAGRRGVSTEQRHQTASSSKNLQRSHHNIL